MTDSTTRLRIGIIGAGEVTQIIHLPTLCQLSHLYEFTAICDLSRKVCQSHGKTIPHNAEHCAAKYHIPKVTTDPQEIIKSPDVDIIFISVSDEFHEPYAIAALEAQKNVFIEKPITLSMQSAQRIIDAEEKSKGRVWVGYMRRHSRTFTDAFKRELESIPKILYARSRDFSGPNGKFTSQSGTFPVKNADFPLSAGDERNKRVDALLKEAFGGEPTPEQVKYARFLGSLGSHDLSLMREALGFPEDVTAVTVNEPFYTATFKCRNKSGDPFFVTYESGIDGVPEFDAHLAVYGENKRVTIFYDSPYIKTQKPVLVRVQEVNDAGEVQTREIISSFEDAFATEFQDMHDCLVNGKEIKTSAEDAINELKLYDLMYAKYAETSK
ncbi:NAD(P)-binding protein [Aureobasidium subglaciale]|nr:NAD(P)-binding protein [Aureobasidium subglaciale]